jgi:hypothetical protein
MWKEQAVDDLMPATVTLIAWELARMTGVW